MIDPNTGQTILSADDIGQLGRELLKMKRSDPLSGLGPILQAYMQQQKPYTGPMASPNLVNNLPDISGQILGLP